MRAPDQYSPAVLAKAVCSTQPTAHHSTHPHPTLQAFGAIGDAKPGRANGGAETNDSKHAARDGDRRSSAGGGLGGRGGGDRRKSGGRGGGGGGRGDGKDGKQGGGSVSEDLQKLVGLIKDKHFEPAIVFSFSRRWGWVGEFRSCEALFLVLCFRG